eukprot:10641197-Heterocapsa_arctica.AAC.1
MPWWQPQVISRMQPIDHIDQLCDNISQELHGEDTVQSLTDHIFQIYTSTPLSDYHHYQDLFAYFFELLSASHILRDPPGIEPAGGGETATSCPAEESELNDDVNDDFVLSDGEGKLNNDVDGDAATSDDELVSPATPPDSPPVSPQVARWLDEEHVDTCC